MCVSFWVRYAKEHRHLRVETDSIFWQRMRSCLPGKIRFTRPLTPEGQSRPGCVVFPHREDCQETFADLYGTDWEALDDVALA